MSNAAFYRELRDRTDVLWETIFDHPFVKGIGDGSLARERFEFYLLQDYVYLIDFSRVLALACAKAPTLNEMGTFAALLHVTLNTEMALHRKTCAAFGIPETELVKTRKSPVTTAYTDFLARAGYEGDFSDLLAVLLPCACGYVEIGIRLKSQGLPDNPFYRDWIDTYSSAEFREFADWLIERMNEHAAGVPAQLRERWHRLYETSARHEFLFFDMSWKKEG